MSVAATRHSPASVVPTPQRVVAWALVACWVALVIATVTLGHWATTFADLEADVAAGEATDVRVAGGLGADSVGYAVVQVRWQRGMLGYSTEVLEVRPHREAAEGASSDVTKVLVNQSVAERLAVIDPDLSVANTGWRSSRPPWDGWALPTWVAVGGVGAVVATVALLIYGPTPRHATRWGWFWLATIAAPLGALAYLLMSGVTSRACEPGAGRRLTGGLALLLALIVELAAGVVLNAVL